MVAAFIHFEWHRVIGILHTKHTNAIKIRAEIGVFRAEGLSFGKDFKWATNEQVFRLSKSSCMVNVVTTNFRKSARCVYFRI